jgi:hypothetical protein
MKVVLLVVAPTIFGLVKIVDFYSITETAVCRVYGQDGDETVYIEAGCENLVENVHLNEQDGDGRYAVTIEGRWNWLRIMLSGALWCYWG